MLWKNMNNILGIVFNNGKVMDNYSQKLLFFKFIQIVNNIHFKSADLLQYSFFYLALISHVLIYSLSLLVAVNV